MKKLNLTLKRNTGKFPVKGTEVYVPEEFIGANIYRKRIDTPIVKMGELQEIPIEAKREYLTLFFRNLETDIENLYDQEFVSALADGDQQIRETIEEIRNLITAEYIKENSSEFESYAFLNGKEEVFYVSTSPLNDTDECIGEVVACPWYDPIRKIRFLDDILKCSCQCSGDLGYFQTELKVKFAVIHDNLYYFF